MVDYYELAGLHCDAVAPKRLKDEVSATARATRNVRAAVRIARDVAAGRSETARVIPVALRRRKPDDAKPYSTI